MLINLLVIIFINSFFHKLIFFSPKANIFKLHKTEKTARNHILEAETSKYCRLSKQVQINYVAWLIIIIIWPTVSAKNNSEFGSVSQTSFSCSNWKLNPSVKGSKALAIKENQDFLHVCFISKRCYLRLFTNQLCISRVTSPAVIPT